MLKLIGIGALGLMLGPSAIHLKGSQDAQYGRILDRGNAGDASKEQRRRDWHQHGAVLVPSLAELVGQGDFDGVVICAGKNGDDYAIVRELIHLLDMHKNANPYFIAHLSTLSPKFVKATHAYCKEHNVQYANYPLTGGTEGARTAKMLILASGDNKLYQRLTPMLQHIGQPKYFGEQIDQGACVKLLGHILVFHGLLGISLALQLHKHVFNLPHLGDTQIDFFDFLNQGAGGTRQWDANLRPALLNSTLAQGFLLQHAAVDIIYLVDLLLNQSFSHYLLLPLLEIALLFCYLIRESGGVPLATQAFADLLTRVSSNDIDVFLKQHLRIEPRECLQECITLLPESMQKSIMLQVDYS